MIWLTGASGFLGSYVLPELRATGASVGLILGRRRVEAGGAEALPFGLEEAGEWERAAAHARPSAIVHLAAISTAGACLADPTRARHVNVEATRRLATVARATGARLVYIGTDMVFDGEGAPYAEDAAPAPSSLYGATKASGEAAALEMRHRGVVLRCPLLYGLPRAPHHNSSLAWLLAGLRGTQALPPLFRDEWRTLADVRHVARAIARATIGDASGVYHLGGPERLSRLQFGRIVAAAFGLPADRIVEASIDEYTGMEPRPRDLSLISERARAELGFDHPPVSATLREWAALEATGQTP